jgi:hypothetical protein
MNVESNPAVPGQIGPYQFERLIGEGGIARTWLGRDGAGRELAIKELTLLQTRTPKQIELFERECAILKDLAHPQIPHFIDTLVERRSETLSLYLVQEFIDGRNLQQLLDAGVKFGPLEVAAVLRSCLIPLAYLHARTPPLLHRDLKPSNILVRRDGTCVLVDFGAVREAIVDQQSGGSSVVGTFGYMAPEQFQARAFASTDLYALGATAVHLLSGIEPARMEFRRLKPNFHSKIKADAHFVAILDLLLEPDAEDRYASVGSLLAALNRWQGKPVSPVEDAAVLRGLLHAADENHPDTARPARVAPPAEAPSVVAEIVEDAGAIEPIGEDTAVPRGRRLSVEVHEESSPFAECLAPGGLGAPVAGAVLALVGAVLAAAGLVGIFAGNGDLVAIIGAIVAAWGLLLLVVPRRGGPPASQIARRGLSAPAILLGLVRRRSLVGTTEWLAVYEFRAEDGLEYPARFRLPGAETARRIAAEPTRLLARYLAEDPERSVLAIRR